MARLRRLPLVLVFAGAVWADPGPERPLFVPLAPVVVGPGSGDVVLADVDGDGHLDLVTRHLLDRSVRIQRGDGKGRFEPAASGPMRLGFQPAAMAIGDANADGTPDLAVAARTDASEVVHVFLGEGRGAWRPVAGSPFAVGDAQEGYKPALRMGDVDEDGKPDLVSANGRRDSIEVLKGDGRGGFARGGIVRLPPGWTRHTFDLGDVDGDGHLDLVVASGREGGSAGLLTVRRGDGDGGFEGTLGEPVTLPADARLGAVADLDGDRRLDVVVGHGSRVSVLRNRADGAFEHVPGSPFETTLHAYAVIAADLDRDGRTDVALTTVEDRAPFGSRVAVLLGDGRTFAPARGSPFPAGRGAYHLALGDVDADGKSDLAAASFEGDSVTLLLGR